jgi:two-component system chemotaxis sensor kinase CheA
MGELDGILKEFLIESHENLGLLDRDLVALEKDPQDRARLGSIFRTIHTIKGTCGFFSFGKLEALTHAGENLLSRLRDGQLELDPEITTSLLALVDAVRGMLAVIEHTGQEGPEDCTSLIETLTRLQEPRAVHAIASSIEVENCPTEAEAGLPSARSTVQKTRISPESPAAGTSEGSVRVDVGLLDKLMNLVGELVLTRNQLLQISSSHKGGSLLSTSQRLNLITAELQEGVMKTRMQPIGNIWNRFPRLVRDLTQASGKQVRIEMEGQGTELDRTIIEAIKDPLTHVVRNAVDHGIEPPDERRARGKPVEGRLRLCAFHEGGQVNIVVSDDGAGIDPEYTRQQAVKRGLIGREQVERLGKRECLRLVFLPGFTTAEHITHVSGRGVGMDVVRTNIEKIGGTVDLQSAPGEGTTLKIKIPLTLAIIPALVVTSGGERYAIPQVNLLELVRLGGEQAVRDIEWVHSVPVYRLRGSLLPLVYLDRLLEQSASAAPPDGEAVNIVVLQADDRRFGLVVGGVQDTEEIVVKPLGQLLKGIPLYAGATILGDGCVALILDVLGVAQHAGVVAQVREPTLGAPVDEPEQDLHPRNKVLLFGLGEERMALPLDVVTHLEEIPRSAVERSHNQEVIQYHGQVIPLIRLARLFLDAADGIPFGPDLLQVMICSDQGRTLGLAVDVIIDIVEAPSAMQRSTRHPSIVGVAVIRGQATNMLHLPNLIHSAAPAFFEELTAV